LLEYQNFVAALLIIFKIPTKLCPTKLFSALYPTKFQIPQQNRPFHAKICKIFFWEKKMFSNMSKRLLLLKWEIPIFFC